MTAQNQNKYEITYIVGNEPTQKEQCQQFAITPSPDQTRCSITFLGKKVGQQESGEPIHAIEGQVFAVTSYQVKIL